MEMTGNKRSSSVVKAGNAQPKKNLWKPEEDLILKQYVETHGEGNWATVSKLSGSLVYYLVNHQTSSLSLSLSLSHKHKHVHMHTCRSEEGRKEL